MEQTKEPGLDPVEALRRIRIRVGPLVGLADEIPLSDEGVAVLIERVCDAIEAARIPSLSLLARDLPL